MKRLPTARRRALEEVVNHYGPEEFEKRRVRVGETYLARRTAAYPVDGEHGSSQMADRVMALPVPEIEVQIDLLTQAADDFAPGGDPPDDSVGVSYLPWSYTPTTADPEWVLRVAEKATPERRGQ
jgi:hypothetical protein